MQPALLKPINPALPDEDTDYCPHCRHAKVGGEIIAGELRMVLHRWEVFYKGQLVPMSRVKYRLLQFMAQNAGIGLSTRVIMLAVWGPAHLNDVQYLRVFISELRGMFRAIDADFNRIKLVPQFGYMWEV